MTTAASDHQNVFDVYLGLTTAGYDMASPVRAGAITDAIATASWDQPIQDYFRKACVNDGRVNPYWPRASILTAVSYFADRRAVVLDLALVRAYLATVRNVSPVETDDDTARWAVALPDYVGSLRSAVGYSEALTRYRDVVCREIKENGPSYQQRIRAVRSILRVLLPTYPSRVLTVLNPLQADPLTDVVEMDDRVYVITSHLRIESYIHELVHVSLNGVLQRWKTRICEYRHLLDPVYEPMVRLSYAWDRTAASWSNVFSETLVRALTAWVLGDQDSVTLGERVEAMVREGFVYVRPIVETLAETAEPHPLSARWLERCLRACREAAGTEKPA